MAVHALLRETERDVLVASGVLSTDYLNHYGEALMLIEMAVMDLSVIEDLRAWRPKSYREHFATSSLRCAPGALQAYGQLDRTQIGAFESLCSAMNRLVDTVLLVLNEATTPGDAAMVVDVAAAAFRSLLARATAFINSGGALASAQFDGAELQSAVDQLMAF
ncbi:MAG: hypothetical protein ACRC56_02365 [Bosea sp. (in: a-proteobacteria)]